MATSSLSALSADAEEFVPSVSISSQATIPLYLNENPLGTIYPTEQQQQQQQQQPLIYPLLKVPEIEFHIQPTQQFHIDSCINHQTPPSTNPNPLPIVLLPPATCYPEPPIFYPSNNQPSSFYSIDYAEPSLTNYSQHQPKSKRISSYHQPRDGFNNSTYHSDTQQQQQQRPTYNNPRNFNPRNNNRTSKRTPPNSTKVVTDNSNRQNGHYLNGYNSQFKFRPEDFPSLPINKNPESDKTPVPTDSKSVEQDFLCSSRPVLSWNTIVSTPRPRSASSHSVASSSKVPEKQPAEQRNDSTTREKKTLENKRKSANNRQTSAQSNSNAPNNKSKKSSSKERKRSKSLTKTSETEKNQQNATKSNETNQTKQSKRSERRKNKSKEEPKIEPTTIPFSLDDENAFPVLGQETIITTTKKPEKDSSTKDKSSTPGLINTSKIKPKQAFEICLTDMFNALSTSTQIRQDHPQSKAKSSTKIFQGANPLDSNPAPKRGKEREQPKPRKPTKLKRIINKELEENQKQRQQSLTKFTLVKQTDENDNSNDNDINNPIPIDNYILDHSDEMVHINENTSTSCTEESNAETDDNDDDDDDDDDDDEILDHEPTSQSQTPYAQQIPQSNIKQQIHDAGFREYCSQLINRQLDELCIQLLITLKRFQDRKKQQLQSNPERARRKRRYVHGIREVTKHLRLQRLKCVLIAPDCQSIQSQGGLNDAIDKMITLCKEQSIPYVFTLNRQKLGRCLNKTSRVSTIGIFDYSGADQIYKQIVDITHENQRAYKQIIDNILNNDETITTPSHGLNSREFYKILHRTFQQNQQRPHVVNIIPNESLSKVLPKVPAHYAHSRQTSDTSTIYIDPQLINSIKKQHARASSGTFDMGKTSTKKNQHQRTLSDGAANIVNDATVQTKQHAKTHSRTPSGCSIISQIEQQDYFEQSKNILMNNNDGNIETDENRLKCINEDTEENSANIKRKNVEKWINDN